MRRSGHARCASIFFAASILFGSAVPAEACTVCFGDPDSSLAHGARWGIVTMVLLTYGLLVGLALMLGLVMLRARRQHAAKEVKHEG